MGRKQSRIRKARSVRRWRRKRRRGRRELEEEEAKEEEEEDEDEEEKECCWTRQWAGCWGGLRLPPQSRFGVRGFFEVMKVPPFRAPVPHVDVESLGEALVDYVTNVGVLQAFSVLPVLPLLILS